MAKKYIFMLIKSKGTILKIELNMYPGYIFELKN